MLNDDPLYLMRLQAMSAADQLGSVALACRVLDIPRSTFYRWRKTYAGMSVSEVQRLKELEQENSRLKRLLAERTSPARAGAARSRSGASCVPSSAAPNHD